MHLRPARDVHRAFRRLGCKRSPLVRSASTTASASDPGAAATDALPARWLSDLKKRIGKCIIFGLRPEQTDEAGSILRILAKGWRALLAGSEGYLVGRGRAGLERHKVVWGEMVCFCGSCYMAQMEVVLTLRAV